MRKEGLVLRKNVHDFLKTEVFSETVQAPVLEIGPMDKRFTPVAEYFVDTRKYYEDKGIKYISADIYPDSGCDIICDVLDLEQKIVAESVGAIIALEVLEHTSRIWEIPSIFWRLLKPGGKIFISVPYYFYRHSPFPDYWRVSEDGLKLLFSDRFVIKMAACYEQDPSNGEVDDRKPIDYTLIGIKK